MNQHNVGCRITKKGRSFLRIIKRKRKKEEQSLGGYTNCIPNWAVRKKTLRKYSRGSYCYYPLYLFLTQNDYEKRLSET